MEPITNAPAESPSITVRGRPYSLKFSLLAQFKLSEMGLSPMQSLVTISKLGPDAIALTIKLLVAFTAHNFVDSGQPVPSPEWWASVIPDEQWGEVCAAIAKALPKPAPPMAADLTAASSGPPAN